MAYRTLEASKLANFARSKNESLMLMARGLQAGRGVIRAPEGEGWGARNKDEARERRRRAPAAGGEYAVCAASVAGSRGRWPTAWRTRAFARLRTLRGRILWFIEPARLAGPCTPINNARLTRQLHCAKIAAPRRRPARMTGAANCVTRLDAPPRREEPKKNWDDLALNFIVSFFSSFLLFFSRSESRRGRCLLLSISATENDFMLTLPSATVAYLAF